MRAGPIQEVIESTIMTFITPVPSTLSRSNANISPGRPVPISIRRLMKKSHLPPLKPAMAPSGRPMAKAMQGESKPIKSEVRAP